MFRSPQKTVSKQEGNEREGEGHTQREEKREGKEGKDQRTAGLSHSGMNEGFF